MKKLFLAAVVAVCGLTGVNAQSTGFEAEAYAGLPMGDVKDAYSFNFGINAAYYWDVAESFKAGAMIGYDYWSGKDVDLGFGKVKVNAGFMPIAASAKYGFGENFFGGVDLGYAIYVGDGDGDGGFLYRPRVGYSAASFDIAVFYKGISVNGGSFSSIGAGFTYKF